MRKRKSGQAGFTLIELMAVTAIISIVAAVAVPGVMSAVRSANERNASASLRGIVNAETNFKNSFGFYMIRPMSGLYTARWEYGKEPGKYIDESLARADADVAFNLANRADDINGDGTIDIAFHDIPRITKWGSRVMPKSGYIFACVYRVFEPEINNYAYIFANNGSVRGPSTFAWYHFSRFAFQAYPVSYRNTGRFTFVIDEGATVYQRDNGRYTRRMWECPSQRAQGWGYDGVDDSLSTWRAVGN